VASYPASFRLLPNAVTVLALCSGLTAVHFALDGRFDLAVVAIAAAAVFDALDGGLARLLDASSKIGAELDSLSDLVAFGVSPALLFYIWRLDGNRLWWVVALVFAVCMALRLARFNTLIDAEQRWPFTKEFFVGVPAPAAALIGALPLLLWLQFGEGWWSAPVTVGLWALLAAVLMVSRLPTVSMKTAQMPPRLVAPALVLVGLGFAVLVAAPFLMMIVIAVG
jgi:CDP-diacylglycerol---serine O-phosphatidyltransferase